MTAEAPPKRAAVYTRVSTEDQAREGFSLGDQAVRAREVIDREGWTFLRIYEDVGFSGDDPERPAYKQMLEDVAAGDLDAIVVIALDRFGRDAWAIEGTLRFFDANGVRLVSTREPIDRATPEGTLQTGILAQFAQFEKAKIKARTKAGISARAKKGKPWGEPKFGYRRVKDGDDWEPDPRERDIVHTIFQHRVEGSMSYSGIARRLTADHVPTRRAGGHWTATTVKKICESRDVLGFFQHNGQWIRGRHEPIVGEQTWRAAQALAADGSKFGPSRPGRRPARHVFINGHLRCDCCGEAMLPRTTPSGDWYECRTNRALKGRGSCAMPRQRREDIDGHWMSMFERSFLSFEKTRAEVAAQLERRGREITEQLSVAETDVAKLESQRARIERHYLNEILSAESYERFSGRLADDAAAATAARDRLAASWEEAQRIGENADAEEVTLRHLAALRDSVALDAREAKRSGDLDALRAASRELAATVCIRADGRFARITPGPRLLVPVFIPGNESAVGVFTPRDQALPLSIGGEQSSPARRCRASSGSGPGRGSR